MKYQVKPKYFIFLIIFVLLLCGGLFAYSKIKNPVVHTSKTKLGYIKVMAELPMYIAIEKNYFKDQGLDIELVPLGYKEEVDALIRGDIDIIPATSLTLPFGVAAQSPGAIKIFSLGGISDNDSEVVEGILVQNDSSIRTMDDLKGKRIGVADGSTDYFVMKTVLTKLNLDPEKEHIDIVQMKKEILPQAFISKNVDAIYLTQPQLGSVKQQTSAKYLVVNPRAKYVLNPFWSGGGMIKSNYLSDAYHKKIFSSYMKAIDAAIDFMRSNPLESKTFLAKYADIDKSLTADMGNYFKVKSTETADMKALQQIADIYTSVGILDKKITVSDLVLPRN